MHKTDWRAEGLSWLTAIACYLAVALLLSFTLPEPQTEGQTLLYVAVGGGIWLAVIPLRFWLLDRWEREL